MSHTVNSYYYVCPQCSMAYGPGAPHVCGSNGQSRTVNFGPSVTIRPNTAPPPLHCPTCRCAGHEGTR